MVCDGKGENFILLSLAENNYSEGDILQGFSQAVKTLGKCFGLKSLCITGDWGGSQKGQKETIKIKRCIMKVTVEKHFDNLFPEAQIIVVF